MSMVSRKRSRLLITLMLAVALVGTNAGSFGSRAWAGEPDLGQNMPTSGGQLSLWAILHGILYAVTLPLP